jgi:hypothetical protein
MEMHRVIGVLWPVLCPCLMVGCGGLSPRQAAVRDAQQLLGDPQARVIHVETFTNYSDTREAVVTVQSHFKMQSECPPVLSGSHYHCPRFFHPRYVALDFLLPPGPATSAGWETLSPSMVNATAVARSASPLFKLFPDIGAPAIRCAIPRGSPPSGTIAGGCFTRTDPTPSNQVRRVVFMEHWPLFRTNRYGGVMGSKHAAGWIVTLSRNGRVKSILVKGQPPQLSK